MEIVLGGLAGVLAVLLGVSLRGGRRDRDDFREARAAAQDMCQLVGDAERLLEQNAALWRLMTPEIAEMYSRLSEEKGEHSVLRSPLRDWSARAGKITYWKEKAAERTKRYSAVIGQDPDESRYRGKARAKG